MQLQAKISQSKLRRQGSADRAQGKKGSKEAVRDNNLFKLFQDADAAETADEFAKIVFHAHAT